jgi:hypothetical protein
MKNIISNIIAIALFTASNSALAEVRVVNEAGSNVSVLRTFPTGVNIAFKGQLSWNAVVVDPQQCSLSSSNDSPFAEENLVLDCTNALQEALNDQMPHLTAPIAGQFLVPASMDLVHSNESTNTNIVVRNFSCSLQEVQTASRENALQNASGIGFFFAETQATATLNSLKLVSRAIGRTGDTLAIHRFVAPAFCTGGSRLNALRTTYSFRPYMEFHGTDETIYRSWDNVSSDYVISEGSVRAFDRSAQILQ